MSAQGPALAGRVALVTGSSRNIGRAIALALAEAGADVAIHARERAAEAESVAGEARAIGARAVTFLADVRDPEAVARGISTVRKQLGPIDILVNCAAGRRERAFEQLDFQEWREVVSVILDGAYVCTHAAIADLVASGHGRVINVIGQSGQAGAARRAHVSTAKAGLIGLTRALALEYADRGVTVNGVSPGTIDTVRAPGAAQSHRAGILPPVGRVGRPEDVASACRFLASDEASFITGQILSVNGGSYL